MCMSLLLTIPQFRGGCQLHPQALQQLYVKSWILLVLGMVPKVGTPVPELHDNLLHCLSYVNVDLTYRKDQGGLSPILANRPNRLQQLGPMPFIGPTTSLLHYASCLPAVASLWCFHHLSGTLLFHFHV
jgi:hypothetical protein